MNLIRFLPSSVSSILPLPSDILLLRPLRISFSCSLYTFFLAIPTMLGASLLKALKFVLDGSVITGQETVILVVGCAVAFAVSIAAVKYLLNYVRSHSFKAFGVYRIALGIVVILWALLRK